MLVADLVAVADLLAILPEAARAGAARRLVREAHAAHKYQRRFGRLHPAWGDGSLMSRCRSFGAGRGMATAEDLLLAAGHLHAARGSLCPGRPALAGQDRLGAVRPSPYMLGYRDTLEDPP